LVCGRSVAGFISIALVLAVAACGSASTQSHTRMTTIVRAAPTTRHKAVFLRPPADTIVQMRQLARSLLWQTVFVRRNGQGVLTSLMGEIGGAPQRSFRLPPDQLAKLRRLIAAARTIPPPADETMGAELYTLHIPGDHPRTSRVRCRPRSRHWSTSSAT
jgi:hypothetical protein